MLFKSDIKVACQKQLTYSQAVACGAHSDNTGQSQLKKSAELCSAGGFGSWGFNHPFSSLGSHLPVCCPPLVSSPSPWGAAEQKLQSL